MARDRETLREPLPFRANRAPVDGCVLIGRLRGTERPGLREAETFLEAYRPHRTMAAAYLWASLSQDAG